MSTEPSFTPEEIAEAVSIPKAMLDQECSEEHVKEISLFLESWETLAPYLNLKKTTIKEIDREGRTEQEKKLETLQKWKERFIFLATYKVLMEALLKIGRSDHAMGVCRLLTGSLTTGHTQLEGAAGTTPPRLESLPSSNIDSPHKGVGDKILPSTTVEAPQIRAGLPESLEDEIEELETQFDGLVDQVADDIENAIEKGVTKLSRVKRSITQLPVSLRHLHIKFLAGKLSAINKAETINELFSILGSYWDFMNCGLLERLIARFGSMETQQRMGGYLKKLKEFRTQTTVREFTDKWTGDIPSNLAEFVLEMGEEWMDRSLEAVEELRIRLSRQCSFNEYALPLKKGSHNSVILCFALQRSFPMSAEILQPAQQFLQEQGVLRVFFKGVCLLDLQPPQGDGSTQGEREKLTPDQRKSLRMKRHQKRERKLLQVLQNPRREEYGRSRRSKHQTIEEKSLDEPSHPSLSRPLEGLDYHPKTGERLDRSECMIIVSVGSEHPNNVRVEPKVENETRAQQAVNVYRRLPDIVKLPLGTEVDLNVISGLFRADSLTDLQLDISGYQRSREYYLQAIRNFFTRCKQPGASISYTGHGEKGTGNWCFKDGTINFQEVFNLYREYFSGRLLLIVSDCCYSGHWVEACAETLDNLGIPPCGHKARESGVLIKVVTSCQSHQKAGDPCYSLEGVGFDEVDRRILFLKNKQLSKSQTTWFGDFTRLVCLRDPDGPCQADNFKNWRWKEAVSGEMRQAIYSVKGNDRGRPSWHYVLLSSGGKEHVSAYKAQVSSGTVIVADWGHILLSGWGQDIPQNIRDKVYQWTYV